LNFDAKTEDNIEICTKIAKNIVNVVNSCIFFPRDDYIFTLRVKENFINENVMRIQFLVSPTWFDHSIHLPLVDSDIAYLKITIQLLENTHYNLDIREISTAECMRRLGVTHILSACALFFLCSLQCYTAKNVFLVGEGASEGGQYILNKMFQCFDHTKTPAHYGNSVWVTYTQTKEANKTQIEACVKQCVDQLLQWLHNNDKFYHKPFIDQMKKLQEQLFAMQHENSILHQQIAEIYKKCNFQGYALSNL